MAHDHDKRYKKLFSHPVMVKELLLYFMVIRRNRYLAEFYEFLSHVVTGNEIPAAFPVMLYNGEDKWTASTNM